MLEFKALLGILFSKLRLSCIIWYILSGVLIVFVYVFYQISDVRL